MDGSNERDAPKEVDFGVVARRTVDAIQEPRRRLSRRPTRIAERLVRIAPTLLAIFVVAGSAMALGRIPSPPPAGAPPEQQIQDGPRSTSSTVTDVDPLPQRVEATNESKRTKRETPRAKPHRVRFAVGLAQGATATGTTADVNQQPAGQPSSARGRSRGKTKGGKQNQVVPQPQASLLFRRLHKSDNGDHFHSVEPNAISAKKSAGYEVVESIGYLFEEQVQGTRLLAIDEGVMGWIYEADMGSRTRPLYRLQGPDYHDHEVIFTSSESVKDDWMGAGWRLERIEGYVVVP